MDIAQGRVGQDNDKLLSRFVSLASSISCVASIRRNIRGKLAKISRPRSVSLFSEKLCLSIRSGQTATVFSKYRSLRNLKFCQSDAQN